MTQLTPLQCVIMHLAQTGIAAAVLRTSVMQAHPELSDSEYLSALLTLQHEQRLFGEAVAGTWTFSSIAEDEIVAHTPEYSAEFAEMIIAADCGAWTAISSDQLLAELDAMLAQARPSAR